MKSLFLGLFSVAILSMASCSRDYYCRCTYSYSGVGAPPDTEETIHITGGKGYAETTCEERNEVFVNDEGDSTSVVCNLY